MAALSALEEHPIFWTKLGLADDAKIAERIARHAAAGPACRWSQPRTRTTKQYGARRSSGRRQYTERSPDLEQGRRIWSEVGEDEGRVGVAEVERVPGPAAAAVAAARRRRKRTRATEPRLLLLLLVVRGGRRGPGKRTGAAELLLLLLVGVAGEQRMGEGCERLLETI
ncbi:hypothetical protein GQ55_6G059900 [Panicum hallii var. hallii]|uniref:Uncharacterized protein n=1 Tax=Panicum hallii var. hallii TaxID=1504633 RepID=A0A2T7D4I8_9POAL|nr:hypothetical protein GQ55_6G059900 [Panicum hallii var. hallii]